MTRGRGDAAPFESLAAAWLREVRAAGDREGTNPVVVDGLALDPLDLLRGRLHPELAALLYALDEGAHHIDLALVGRRAFRASSGRVWSRDDHLSPATIPTERGTGSPRPREGSRDVLLLVHDPAELSIMEPVIDALAAHGLSAACLTASGAVARVVRRHEPCIVLDTSALRVGQVVTYVARAARSVRTMLATSLPELEIPDRQLTDHGVVRRRLARVSGRVTLRSLPALISMAVGVRDRLIDLRPRSVVVADPDEPWGRTTLAVAQQLGIATVAIERTPIVGAELRWSEVPAELVCVRNEASRAALRGCGVVASAIAVTGAPHLRSVGSPPSCSGADAAAAAIAGVIDRARVIGRRPHRDGGEVVPGATSNHS